MNQARLRAPTSSRVQRTPKWQAPVCNRGAHCRMVSVGYVGGGGGRCTQPTKKSGDGKVEIGKLETGSPLQKPKMKLGCNTILQKVVQHCLNLGEGVQNGTVFAAPPPLAVLACASFCCWQLCIFLGVQLSIFEFRIALKKQKKFGHPRDESYF